MTRMPDVLTVNVSHSQLSGEITWCFQLSNQSVGALQIAEGDNYR